MKKPHIRKSFEYWEVVFPAIPDPLCPGMQFQWIPAWCKGWRGVELAIKGMSKHADIWAVAGQPPLSFIDKLPLSVRRA